MSHPVIVLLVVGISLYGYYIFQRWQSSQPPAVVQKTLTRVALYLGITLLLILALTGRLHWLLALIATIVGALIPLIRRFLPLLVRYLPFLAGLYRQAQAAKSAKGPSQSQQSVVETNYVRMTLDHDTGEMDGKILKGRYQGKFLAQLSQQQVLELLHECEQTDTDAVALLEAYLDRSYGTEWRNQGHYENSENDENIGGKFSTTDMSNAEAYEILGLKPSASQQEILDAHRHLIAKFHPDRGGSNYLATKINQAKDVLLNK